MKRRPYQRPGDELLRLTVAAQMLGVHRNTVRNWIEKGLLPHERVGPYRVKRVRRSVLERYRVVVNGADV